MNMDNRVCTICNIEKSLNDFHGDKYGKYGKCSACKNCVFLKKYGKPWKEKRDKYKAVEFKNGTKLCTKCGLIKEFNKFYFLKKLNRYRSFCIKCESDGYFKKTYKVSSEDYLIILEKKKVNKCEICGGKNKDKILFIDHNHTTGSLRGIICHNCNISIGLLKENVDRIEKIIKYLKKYKNLSN